MFLFPLALLASFLVAAVSPPVQPASGLGGRSYAHKSVRVSSHGDGADGYVLIEPDSPRPARAPVVVFLHGWSAMDPEGYEAWLAHIAKKGRIVIFPRYQASLMDPPGEFTPNAIKAVKDALALLSTEADRVRPQPGMFAVVGHSMGGLIAANVAALARENSLPQPKAVMVIQPGRTWGLPAIQAPLANLQGIPASTLLLVMVSDRDRTVRDVDGKRIFRETTNVPLANKDFVTLRSDEHGSPPLIADHRAACAAAIPASAAAAVGDLNPCPTNALDFYGTWKLFDALTNAAFFGTDRDTAFGNTAKQTFMGRWSDGTPVKPLLVTDAP